MADPLRQPCVNATQAFLHKDYVQCLIEIEKGLEISREGIQASLEQLLVLRFTVVSTIYAHAAIRHRVMEGLRQAEGLSAHKLEHMLGMSPGTLFIELWYECLYALAREPPPETLPSSIALTPITEQVLLRIPTPVLSSAVLTALRMDVLANTATPSARSQNARQACECFFFAVVQADVYQDAEKYERILRLYTIEVLGLHLGEWEYAYGFVDYSTLPPSTKLDVLNALSAAQEKEKRKVEHESEVLRQAQQHYESEKNKRSADVPPQDTQSAQPPSVPLPMPSETVTRPTVQRAPSIRARPASLTEEPSPPSSSHSDQRQHLQQYLQRRPAPEPVTGSIQPRSSSWWSFFLSHITRQRALSTILTHRPLPRLLQNRIPENSAIAFVVAFGALFIIVVLLGLLLKVLNPPRLEARHASLPPVGVRPAATGRRRPALDDKGRVSNAAASQANLLTQPSAQGYSPTPSNSVTPYSYANVSQPAPYLQSTHSSSDAALLSHKPGRSKARKSRALPVPPFESNADQQYRYNSGNADPYAANIRDQSPFESQHEVAPATTTRPSRSSRGYVPLPEPPLNTNAYSDYRDDRISYYDGALNYYNQPQRASNTSHHYRTKSGSSQLSRVDSIGAGDHRRHNSKRSRKGSTRKMTTAERVRALREANADAKESSPSKEYADGTAFEPYTDSGYHQPYANDSAYSNGAYAYVADDNESQYFPVKEEFRYGADSSVKPVNAYLLSLVTEEAF
ncbi:hypothetical protein MCAP1_001802 [Malassezia caprae]|uniref:Uncharacterized protein n=1 Tax=Malassezia caprae TaxID=1381934 RepID=A0AAF0IWH3_9BASI|nr:hypothetical protein MCAP1_001802 [Malassezia caprae]